MRRTFHAIQSTPLMAMASRLSMRLWRVAVGILSQDSGHHANAQHDEREADKRSVQWSSPWAGPCGV